ncbi:MAG: amidohydrolase family protein, partial [Planctomycetes bacterium]|nr:amidohydrolase family protein [Planctomycetota bacterium]
RNLKELAPLVTGNTWHRCLLVSDDRSALDLRDQGHMDHAVRRAIEEGILPVRAIAMASLNPAAAFGFARRGALAPGYLADVALVSDLKSFEVRKVFFRGRLAAQDGALVEEPAAAAKGPANTVRVGTLGAGAIWIRAERGETTAVGVVPGQIVTRAIRVRGKVKDGAIVPDPDQDLLKLVVVERHTGSKRAAACLVKGFGLKRGALASSVAHDSHNLIAAGASDEDILAALDAVAKAGGGQCFASGGEIEALLPLPVAGLLSERPLAEVCEGVAKLRAAAKAAGCALEAPFETLSFLALPVIPEVKLTDRGLVDVMKQEFIS